VKLYKENAGQIVQHIFYVMTLIRINIQNKKNNTPTINRVMKPKIDHLKQTLDFSLSDFLNKINRMKPKIGSMKLINPVKNIGFLAIFLTCFLSILLPHSIHIVAFLSITAPQ
jgi:hypothetical protein